VLSRNEIQEIVMDSDSDEDKHYAFQESEDEEELCPPFRCVKCDVALCVDRNCFQDYHSKTKL
jgi:hypothetical protein